MRQKAVSLFLCYLILFACGAVEAGKRRRSESSENSGSGWWSTLTYMAVGGGGRGASRAGLHERRHRRQLDGRLADELVGRSERGRRACWRAGGHAAEPRG
nr:PREDICTED: interferon alpha-inducible protein 6 isoform X2 [Equus przewalskii]